LYQLSQHTTSCKTQAVGEERDGEAEYVKPDDFDRRRDPALRATDIMGDCAMPDRNKAEIIRGLFAAYRSNDRKAVEDSFTGDFRFASPYDDNIDKATYFARCWRNSEWIERQDLERIFVEGNEAFVTYRCVANDGKDFRNTEFFTFDGDRIKRIDVYFGATYQNGVFIKQQG
jgi:ketosteroid isomerase-like protein